MSPNLPERREKTEPVEGAEPIPRVVWFTIAGLVTWGFAYLLLFTGSPDEVGGDQRTAPIAVAAGGAVDGKAVYATRCQSCHQPDGKGVPGAFPPLAGAPWPTGDAAVPVRIVLHGLQGPIDVLGATYAGVMPAFGSQLSDAEIAAVLTYVRGAFGNTAGPVAEADVAGIRAAAPDRREPWTAEALR